MATASSSARMIFACLATAACTACDAAGDPALAADPASETTQAQVVDALPLRPGFYVADDTPCGEASNATLHLPREDGGGYGGFTTPPYFCEFQPIEQTGPSSFRTSEACGSAHGGNDDHQVTGSSYEILSDTSYRARNDDGWESSARRCPRDQLPAVWRDYGFGDFVD